MEYLQDIRNYLIAGSCLLATVPMLFCLGAWLYTSPGLRRLFRTLICQFRSLAPFGKLLTVVFLATFIAMGSTKTNNASPRASPPSGIVFDGGLLMQLDGDELPMFHLTTNQYRAGFAHIQTLTNASFAFSVPSNAVLYTPWTRYGVVEDTLWLPACAAEPGDAAGRPATNWSFILGTNQVDGLHVSSSGTLSFGWTKGSPRAHEMPDGSELDFLAPLQTDIGIVPPVGRFWHAPTPSNSLLLTWQEVYANRDTNYPISFQSELFANGDFTFRYDLSRLSSPASRLPSPDFVIGAQNNGGGETYAFGDTNRIVHGLELRWRAFGLLDPGIDDHDGDGLSTYDEVMLYGTDPRLADTDFDGISDPNELTVGTDPRNPDSDGDGLADGIDPQPLVWNDPEGDADNDGYSLWQELLYGTSDTVPGDVAQLLANGSRKVTFTIAGTPGLGAVLALGEYPLPLAGRTTFDLDLPNGTVMPLALDNAMGVTVGITSPDCIALTERTGGLAPGGTGTGAATLVLPVITIGSGGQICLHEANQTITATVTVGLPGHYDWLWEGGANTGGRNAVISSSGVLPGDLTVKFWPDGGNGAFCKDSVQLAQCRRIYCVHGLPARECGFCTGGSSEAWCSLHDEWKCRCACLTLGGGGMLAPDGETICSIGTEDDSCHNHIHHATCCDCPEHAGWSLPEAKTNNVRQVSARLDVRLGGVVVAAGKKLAGPTSLTIQGEQLSVTFNDARIVASHELHPSATVTSAWTVAAIGLDPERVVDGRCPIRVGTNCVTRVTILTDSALTEGSLRLDAGATSLRFSETEGAALSGAQTNRTDTPPASVGASRDFWLGAPAGGSHTLRYALRKPQGATCLTTNLAIEAIVAKFATNTYFAVYGANTGIDVALSDASYDPAGYTLRLNGTFCATGQPPWRVAVSNLAAGAHTLTVRSKIFPDLVDEAALYILKVDTIDATSPKSGASANPPPFLGSPPWPFDVTHSPNPDKHMVVFFKDVIDSSFNVQDFDVTLKANILPANITADQLNEFWSKIIGPDSGSLNWTDTFEVKYQNPKLGGVYRFDFDLGLSGCTKSEANVVLPQAGAEMDGVMQSDLTRADAFATAVKARYTPRQLQQIGNWRRWFWDQHAGDYTGRPDNANTPTVWVYNQVDDDTGFGAVCTWQRRPVRLTKLSNFILGYAMQKIGTSRAKARRGTGLFTITETTDRASVGAGWDVANGGNYDTTVSNLVDYIWTHEAESDKSRTLWPNPNAPDNYRGASTVTRFDYNTGYGAPGFLFMTR